MINVFVTGAPAVDTALGQSLFYDEYKGHFRSATVAANALEVAQVHGDAPRVAQNLYAKGRVHFLRGECLAALASFQQARQMVDNVGLLALASWDAEYLTRVLHLRRLPDGTAHQITEVLTRWNKASIYPPGADKQERRHILQTIAPSELSLHQQLAGDILGSHSTNSAILSDDAHNRGHASDEILNITVGDLNKYLSGNPTTLEEILARAYLIRLMAQECFCGGFWQKAFELAQTAANAFAQAGDEIAVAAVLLDQADWFAAPGSSPLHCGLIVGDMAGYNSRQSVAIERLSLDHSQANYQQASQMAENARRLFAQHKAFRGMAAANLRLGYIHWRQGQLAQAGAYYQQALAGFKDTGDTLNLWVTRAHQALLGIARQPYPEDRKAAAAIGRWGHEGGSPAFAYGLGQLCSQMGREWLAQGDYERALACYRLAETVFTHLHMPYYTAQATVDQAEAFLAAGLDQAALGQYFEAIDRLEQVAQEPFPLAKTALVSVMMLGSELFNLQVGRKDGAGIRRTIALLEKNANRLSQAAGPAAPNPLEDLMQMLSGETTEIDIDKLLGNVMQPAMADTSEPEQDESLTGSPLPGMEQLALAAAMPYVSQGAVLGPLYEADAKREQGYPQEAEALYQQALAAVERGGNDVDRLQARAFAYAQMRRYDEAVAQYRQYLMKRSSSLSGIKIGDISKNIQMQALMAQQQKNIFQEAASFYAVCQAYQDSLAMYAQLEHIAGADWWRQEEKPWETLLDMGAAYAGIGEHAHALAVFDEAIRIQEERRREVSRDQMKVSWGSSIGVSALYFHTARTCLQMGDAVRSWEYAEQGRSRALLDLMTSGATMGGQPETVGSNLQQWRQLNAQLTVKQGQLAVERSSTAADAQRLAQFAAEVQQIQQILTHTEEELATVNPAFYRLINPQVDVVSLDQVQKALPAGTLLIGYLLREMRLIGWGVNQRGIVSTFDTEVDARDVTGDVNQFLRAIEAVGQLVTKGPTAEMALAVQRQTCEKLATRLGDLLLKPFAEALQQHDHLVVVPDGALHKLPFAALTWQGVPLCASHSLSFAPSASVLLQTQLDGRTPGDDQAQLAVGISSKVFAPLQPGLAAVAQPGLRQAEVEAKAVAVLGAGQTLLGDEVTADNVRHLLPRFKRIHFATHALAYEQIPLASVLCLKDNPLSLYELFGLNLAADLVVLSACRTGAGNITRGGEVTSFARGLLAAGANAVIVSLWPVDDTATALFMAEFYRQLKVNTSIAAALKLAQTYLRTLPEQRFRQEQKRLWALAQGEEAPMPASDGLPEPSVPLFADMYYWAPFILIGNWQA
jgi:CHAT domain-containing protein/tetratricopeptide (TPR) repeat protein